MLALSQFFADLDLPSRKPCKPWRTERIFATSRRRSGSASEARVTPDRELTGDPNPTHRLAANLTNWIETVMTHPSTVRRPIPVEHVAIEATKPFEAVKAALESLVPPLDAAIPEALRRGEAT